MAAALNLFRLIREPFRLIRELKTRLRDVQLSQTLRGMCILPV